MKANRDQRLRQRLLRSPRAARIAERAGISIGEVLDAAGPLVAILKLARARNPAPALPPTPKAPDTPPSEPASGPQATPIVIGMIAAGCMLIAAQAPAQTTYLDPNPGGSYSIEQGGLTIGSLRPYETYDSTAYTVVKPNGWEVEGYLRPLPDGGFTFDRLPGAGRHRR
jgi:hypothetical protein